MKTIFRTNRKIKKPIIVIVSVIATVALYIYGYFNYLYIPEGEAQFHFINVGQGDAALILTDSGSVLIDAGTTESGGKVAAYVKKYTDSIDYVILSHPHEDHIGGASEVFENVDVKNVIMPDAVADSASFDRTMEAIENENADVYPADIGDTYNVGDLRMEIFSPETGRDYEETNNVSIVVKVTFGKNSVLFTGDAEKPIEEELVSRGADLDSDVLKVGHHGSSTSSSEEFISAVSPEIAVVSCGKYNSYGHPHYEVTELMEDRNIEMLRTDWEGDIVLISDGIEITTE